MWDIKIYYNVRIIENCVIGVKIGGLVEEKW